MSSEYQTELILAQMRKITALATQDEKDAMARIGKSSSEVQTDYEGASDKIEQDRKEFALAADMLRSVAEDAEKEQRFSSTASFAAAIQNNIKRKQQAKRALEGAGPTLLLKKWTRRTSTRTPWNDETPEKTPTTKLARLPEALPLKSWTAFARSSAGWAGTAKMIST